MKITVLGCGSSSGTPSVEWGWGKCDPNNPKNTRLRPSILVEEGEKRILVDTSPDLRSQLLDFDIKSLDAVLLTHSHSDHLHGIDDIRAINRLINGSLTLFSSKETLETVAQRFPYVFEPLAESAAFYYKATLEGQAVVPGNSFNAGGIANGINGINVMPIAQDHGFMDTLGFRFGDFAYSTDLVTMGEESFELLVGTKVWMLGTFSDKPHPTHLDVDRALEWIHRIKPQRAILTHLGPGLDYETLSARLPDNVQVAFDGMVLDI